MKIQIIQKQCGGTEFLAQPHRLHLGAQNAAGVDELLFQLPDAWAGCSLALYLRRSDGTLLAPVALDTQHRVTVDRRLTGSTGGQWMLAAMGENGYTAYTRPGSYDCYAILPIDDDAEELPPSLYEQFVARVLESSSSASTAAQRAAASAASTAANAAQAQTAAQRTSTDSANASQCAARAEAAAARAEELVPTDGQVVSVNGKSGIVKLTAQEVGALPCPAQPVSGQLLRVLSVDPNTGAVLTDTAAMPDLSPYLRSSTVPTASVPGAVRVDPACGINVRSDGTLTTAPADRSQLDSMDSTVLPLPPALLPYGVKKALTAAASAGEWTADEKAAALRTIRIAPAIEGEAGLGRGRQRGALPLVETAEAANVARLRRGGAGAHRERAHAEHGLQIDIRAHRETIRGIGGQAGAAAEPADEMRPGGRDGADARHLARGVGARARDASIALTCGNVHGELLGGEHGGQLRIAGGHEAVVCITAHHVALGVGPVFECVARERMRGKVRRIAGTNRSSTLDPAGRAVLDQVLVGIGHRRHRRNLVRALLEMRHVHMAAHQTAGELGLEGLQLAGCGIPARELVPGRRLRLEIDLRATLGEHAAGPHRPAVGRARHGQADHLVRLERRRDRASLRFDGQHLRHHIAFHITAGEEAIHVPAPEDVPSLRH